MRKIIVTAVAGLLFLQLVSPALVLAIQATPPGILKQALEKRGRAVVGMGTLKSKSGDVAPATLVITKEGKDYVVNVDATTQLRRRFWGKATLAEMSVNDTVGVIGQWTDDTRTTINAKLVRDVSIQKRFGVFFGTVTTLTTNGWVMETLQRESQTVTTSSSTKFVNRNGEPIGQADVKVGDRIRVRGLWNSKQNTITEISHVKNYSLPTKAAPTPTATP